VDSNTSEFSKRYWALFQIREEFDRFSGNICPMSGQRFCSVVFLSLKTRRTFAVKCHIVIGAPSRKNFAISERKHTQAYPH
jgi:hypothetical protein